MYGEAVEARDRRRHLGTVGETAIPVQEPWRRARVQGVGGHGSHAKYTHHDEDLSRAMENLLEVKEKRFPYWKREGKLVFPGEGNMRFLKNLAVNLLITQVPALFLLIGYPHASLKEIILLSAGNLILSLIHI